MHMDMLFINAFLFIKAGSPRPSAAQQGAAVPVCLLREQCDLPVTLLCSASLGAPRRLWVQVKGRQDPES